MASPARWSRGEPEGRPVRLSLVGAVVPFVGAMIAFVVAPLAVGAQATITVPMVERTVEDRWIEAHRVPSLVPWATHRWRLQLPDGGALCDGGPVDGTLVVHRYGPSGPEVSW